MRRAILVGAIGLTLAVPGNAVAARPERATEPQPLRALPTSLLVTLHPGADPASLDGAAARLGLARVAWNPEARTAQYVALQTGGTRAAMIRAAGRADARERGRIARLGADLGRLPGVEAATLPVTYELLEEPTPTPTPEPTPTPPPPVAAPNDPYWPNQWGPDAIGARGAWTLTRGRSEIVVAVLDTGVDLGHPDLRGRLVPGTDLGSGDTDPTDLDGHGTHVAGIIAAVAGNAVGVSGAAPGVVVMPVKVENDLGRIYDVTVAEGITWAVARGARVVNLSLGGAEASPAVNAAIDAARARGVVVVAAAGNNGTAVVSEPAAYDPTLAIAALTDRGSAYGEAGSPARYARAWYSNYGPAIDLAAPGTSILSTLPRVAGAYGYASGTSMATPFVAAVAALLISRDPSLAAADVEAALAATAVDLGTVGRDEETGWGLVRADAATRSIARPPSDGTTPTVTIAGITDGTVVRGLKTLVASAADDSPIVALRIYRDGVYQRVRRASTHSMTWTTTRFPDGLHRWTAYGTDAGLRVGSALVRVLVANDRSVRSIRESLAMTSTTRSISRTAVLARTGPFVARFTGPAGATIRVQLRTSTGRVVADVKGRGAVVIALPSLKSGRYTIKGWAATAIRGRELALRADWFR